MLEEAPFETRPRVTITVPQSAKDGDMVEFSVSVQDGTPTSYEWSFEAPGGAGNNPQVNFNSPTSAATTAKAHWFAKPNSACSASFDSTYEIEVKVSFANRSPITKKANFTVSVGRNWGGGVDYPMTPGLPDIEYDSNRSLYIVVGQGEELQRIPSQIVMRTPETSQFYNKTLKHEEVHYEQFVSGIFKDLYKIDNLMPRLLLLTDAGRQPLEQKVFQAKENWRAEQKQIAIGRLPESEREAYAVSDPIAPRNLFNNCGRF